MNLLISNILDPMIKLLSEKKNGDIAWEVPELKKKGYTDHCVIMHFYLLQITEILRLLPIKRWGI